MFKYCYWFIGLLLLIFVVYVEVISVIVIVDKNLVMFDEVIILIVIVEGDVEREVFDSLVLFSDFVVGCIFVSL